MSPQSGNVLFLILIAVALFATLSYAVTQSSRGGGDGISKDQAALDGTAYIKIGTDVKVAAQRLMLFGGCDVSELSFDWTPGTGGENNPIAPTDLSCHVFAPGAGGIDVPEDLHVSSGTPGWIEVNHTRVEGVGSDSTANNCEGCDLIFWRYTRDTEICEAINKQLLGDSTVYTLSGSFPPSDYDGTFTASEYISGVSAYQHQESFCFREGSGQLYDVYVQVIVAR